MPKIINAVINYPGNVKLLDFEDRTLLNAMFKSAVECIELSQTDTFTATLDRPLIKSRYHQDFITLEIVNFDKILVDEIHIHYWKWDKTRKIEPCVKCNNWASDIDSDFCRGCWILEEELKEAGFDPTRHRE